MDGYSEEDYLDGESHSGGRRRVRRITAGVSGATKRGREGVKKISRRALLGFRDRKVRFLANMGSRYTIIPPEFYDPRMCKLNQSDTKLRSWGSKEWLAVRGMFTAELVTAKGATKTTALYFMTVTTQRQY